MGQYYLIANFTKKEYFQRSDNGIKLLEFSFVGNKSVNGLMDLIKGEWKGSEVAVVGDYTDRGYPENTERSIPVMAYEKYAERAGVLGDDVSLHRYVKENFKKIVPPTKLPSERYLVNTELREYVDLHNLPPMYYEYEGKKYAEYFAPLPLLLAIGNGMGGGDYAECLEDSDKIGRWTLTSEHVRVCDDLREFGDGLKDLKPHFFEP